MDGDMADPAVDDDGGTDDERDPRDRDASSASGPDVSADDDVPERASEIDDITEALERIIAEESEHELGPSGATSGDAPAHLSDIDVAAVLAERDEYRSMAQRVQADFDNFRRRSQAQALAESERATGRLAEALLPVLDAAEAAYLNHPDEIGPLLSQMLTELKRHGLEALDLDGQAFDPEVAEAVAHEPGEGGSPVVAEVLRSGYRWKGRTLRPALVRTRD
jgi:molecular chaperone GrpE